MKDYTNYSLLPYNTFGMDVKAARFVEYESVNELLCFLKEWKAQKTPLLHVGREVICCLCPIIKVLFCILVLKECRW